MKKCLLLFALVPFVFGCNPTEKKGATLSGTATNLSAGFFIIGGPGGAKDSVKPAADGSFTFKAEDLSEPANYYILSGENDFVRMVLEPGMALNVTFDAAAFQSSIRFAGKGADKNNYLVSKTVAEGRMDFDLFKLEADAFTAKQDSTLKAAQALLAAAKKDDPKDPYWTLQEAEVLFGWASNMLMYPSYHGYFTGQTGYQAPEGFNDFKKMLNLNNAAWVKSPAFMNYVGSAVREEAGLKADEMRKADSTVKPDMDKLNQDAIDLLLTDVSVRDHYIRMQILGDLQWKEIDDKLQKKIDGFLASCKDQELTGEVEKALAEWKLLAKGQPAVEITGKDTLGNVVRLSDFKGKLVYVDVWATWCGPCKYEIPYLDTLETDYHGKNIVFISYSIDEDHGAWVKFIPEHHLQGVQLIGESAWASKICKDYKINGVPTFMLFDTEGKIVSVKMTRPSDKSTREKFDELLK